ncbi:kinase domain-containing protein, partial [Desmophyllum pertusum]
KPSVKTAVKSNRKLISKQEDQVVRPVCTSPMPHYCPTNLSCTYQQCSTQSTYHCASPDTLCASKSCCLLPPSGNCSQSSKSTTLRANNLRITADLGVLTIGTGYNLHVLPKNHTFNALPGDMIAWGPAMDGKIAQQSGKGSAYHFSGVDVKTLQTGSDISINQSTVFSNLVYMINIIGSQASTFEMNHQFNAAGEYWAQVNFTNTLGNALAPITQRILVQTPLVNIEPVYPLGFSFYGAPMNRKVEMIVNISTNGNVTVSWTLLNSSSLLKREIVHSSGQSYVVSGLNHTFPNLGTYFVFVEAANNVSVINSTVFVNVQDAISALEASLTQSTPTYLGASTKLNVSVIGTNVKFKWIFGDGSTTLYISNTTVVHRFSRTGTLNVSVTATNLASRLTTWFTVHVVHPLSISLPKQGAVGVATNSTCSLADPFASDQYYYWDYGDGNKEEGLNKTRVSHTYTKGGTYIVSVKLKNEVLVNASSTILVIEPVSGLTLDNFTGVELFDNHTFIARTVTGNNLTYECVNVSNSISSEFASLSFYVQLRIAGLGITAFPNPAPSNSTITFNITKGSGTNVKYRFDFGDGFVLREFPENYLFNRTFASGQWQVIYTGTNAVNHVIVFYNVTVQDPVENVTISVDAETEFHGRKLVAVGAKTRFYSNVSAGTDVLFRWNFGDGSYTYTYKGSERPSGETNHTVGHSFPRVGQFNVTVDAFNAISLLQTWIIVHAQQKIEGFALIVTDRASPGEGITFGFSQTKETMLVTLSTVVTVGREKPLQQIPFLRLTTMSACIMYLWKLSIKLALRR